MPAGEPVDPAEAIRRRHGTSLPRTPLAATVGNAPSVTLQVSTARGRNVVDHIDRDRAGHGIVAGVVRRVAEALDAALTVSVLLLAAGDSVTGLVGV